MEYRLYHFEVSIIDGSPRFGKKGGVYIFYTSYKLLGTREWFVIHHSDCGMQTFSDDTTRKLLKHSLKTASLDTDGWHDVGQGPGSPEGDFIDWLTISDQQEAVIEDVQRIRSHPLVPRDIPIYGYIYDVKSGSLMEVAEASKLGKAA